MQMDCINSQNRYIELFSNTIDLYSSAMKNAIIKGLKDSELVTQYESETNKNIKFPVFFDSREEIIPETISDSDFFSFYENWEYDKSYKYSIPLAYEKDLSNDEFISFIKKLIEDEKIRIFVNSNKFTAYDDILCSDIKTNIPFCKITEKNILFKYVLVESTYKYVENTFIPVQIRCPILISINLNNNFLDIRFDGGKFEYDSQTDYINPKIDDIVNWLKSTLKLKLYNIKHDDIIDIIKNDKTSNVVIIKQMMQLKSGGSAELTASESQEYRTPFIGDLRKLINDNHELFDKAPETRELILNYLDDYEETAQYPYIHVKWIKNNKAQSYTEKIVFDYYKGKLIQIHHMQSANVKRERIENAIEYLFRNGSFIKGDEI